MYYVIRRFEFCAGHRLLGYDGNCARLHGHNYVVDVAVKGVALNSLGMLMDFGDLKSLVRTWIDIWDHHTVLHPKDELRKVLAGHEVPMRDVDDPRELNPTAENMAKGLYECIRIGLPVFVEMDFVRVFETPDCCAEYRE